MVHKNQELESRPSSIPGILLGTLVGSLAGALTMLLLAPQSGKRTRMQIQRKGIDLRDRTTEIVQDAVEQVRSDGNKMVVDGRKKARKLLQHGQVLATRQLDHVSRAAQAGKKAMQSA
jgi:gas vesicle protein